MAQTAVDVTAPELAEPAPPSEADSDDTQNEPETEKPPVAKQAKVLDRVACYVIVELPGRSYFQATQSG